MRQIVVLLVIGAIAGGILGAVYQKMYPLIVKNRQQALKAAVLQVLPKAKSFKQLKKDKLVVYQGLNAKKQPVGWAFAVETPGFQGVIKMMVGVSQNFKQITGLTVLENVETPGLGARITEADFQNQFVALSPKKEIILVKNRAPVKEKNEVEAIAGATISSRAVVNGLNKQILKVRQALGK